MSPQSASSVSPAFTATLSIMAVLLLILTGVGPPVRTGGSASFSLAEHRHHDHGNSATISHVVVVMMENHPFDNYFGAYCPTVGRDCPSSVHGFPAGLCVPLYPSVSTSPCVKPFPFTAKNWSITARLPHTNVSSHAAWNNGAMNNFYVAENSGLTPFGFYNGSTAPLYWDLAQEFGLGDNFFSSTLSYSTPNHWYLLAGQAPAASFKTNLGQEYLNEANNTTSVEDLLMGHNAPSWNYYDYALPTWSQAQLTAGPFQPGAFNYWNPQAAKYESYSRSLSSHFVSNVQFFADAAAGQLPALSWLIPFSKESDHPPGNVTTSESWVASVVNAVEQSSDWNSTALFLSWDDYGGFYDGVAPPYVGGIPLSFRVPLIVISPYTAAGTVVHNESYFESLLHYMEDAFRLGCITTRDCNAPSLSSFFNLTMSPRPPVLFSTNPLNWTYPYVAPLKRGAAWQLPGSFVSSPTGDGTDVD